MAHILKRNLTALLMGLFLLAGSFGVAPAVHAAQSSASSQVCAGITSATGDTCDGTDAANKTNSLVNTLINVLSWIIAVISVFMIMFGGFKMITSAGDSSKVASGRQTIIYALIGLIIVALAQTIVKFVLSKFFSL